MSHALAANAAAYRRALTPKQMEAQVFSRVVRALREAQGPMAVTRAVADAERLWSAVHSSVSDPGNALPQSLRAGLASLSRAALSECTASQPDLAFLADVTNEVAQGLWS